MNFFSDKTQLLSLKKLLSQSVFMPIHKTPEQISFLEKISDTSKTIQSADEISQGIFTFFSKTKVATGNEINWHKNYLDNTEWPRDIHWCKLNNFEPSRGDVKNVWELSRCYWAYNLVRAYQITKNEKYSQTFWELFESWLQGNQPNQGINFGCGQECALRIMAWCFAAFGFLNSEQSTDDRLKKILLAIAIHAERIEKHIGDAVRQKTNHALTEAAALYTIGTLFTFFKKSSHWKKKGKMILEKQGIHQIYPDGSYVQQSMNYHRLMLHTYLWSFRIAELNNDNFSAKLKHRLQKSTEFIYQMQDELQGKVPNYGANDGAMILPLNSCDYTDYRPVIQSANYLFERKRIYSKGPWDEDLFWLFGRQALESEQVDKNKKTSRFDAGGYYTLNQKNAWAMIRCHDYKDRVGHADMLHFDFWADGQNLLKDCGTYKYFAPDNPELEKYFKSIWAHNTVIIDNASPLTLFSRFMYLPWPKAELKQFDISEDKITLTAINFAYNRSPWKVVHYRQIKTIQSGDKWTITDKLDGKGTHDIELRWHLPENIEIVKKTLFKIKIRLSLGWMLKVESENEIDVKILSAYNTAGWQSIYYSDKQPICTLIVSSCCHLPCEMKTILYNTA